MFNKIVAMRNDEGVKGGEKNGLASGAAYRRLNGLHIRPRIEVLSPDIAALNAYSVLEDPFDEGVKGGEKNGLASGAAYRRLNGLHIRPRIEVLSPDIAALNAYSVLEDPLDETLLRQVTSTDGDDSFAASSKTFNTPNRGRFSLNPKEEDMSAQQNFDHQQRPWLRALLNSDLVGSIVSKIHARFLKDSAERASGQKGGQANGIQKSAEPLLTNDKWLLPDALTQEQFDHEPTFVPKNMEFDYTLRETINLDTLDAIRQNDKIKSDFKRIFTKVSELIKETGSQ